MVSISLVKSANATLPSTLPNGFAAVFIGATSGIGLSTLKQLVAATQDKSPRLYIVGRSATAAEELIAELRQRNASATIHFIERDVSLLKETDAAIHEIIQHENTIDLLFLSVGFISFEGRKETPEGLEPSMTTRFYSRVRATELLLPLLNRSNNPHVTNILGGGQEAPMLEDDLDLAKPGNYSFIRASLHSATMLTLLLERFAKENPNISFVHAFPGPTATPLLTRGSSGIVGFLLKWIVSPILTTFFSASVEDVGARALFAATNARYTVESTSATANPAPKGLAKATQSDGGVFLVDAKSESVDNEVVLRKLRENLGERVRSHVDEIFGRITQN